MKSSETNMLKRIPVKTAVVLAIAFAAIFLIAFKSGDKPLPTGNKIALAAQDADVKRAETVRPRAEFLGKNRANMVDVLNAHLKSDKMLRTDGCFRFTMAELNEIGKQMWGMMDDRLNQVYVRANDARQLRHFSLDGMDRAWKTEQEMNAMDATLKRNLIGKKCREMVMWYVHHLNEKAKSEFKAKGLVLPLLPKEDEQSLAVSESKLTEMMSKYPHMKMSVEGDNADASQGCVKCHVDVIEGRPVGQVAAVGPIRSNVRVLYNPSKSCQADAAESFRLNNLAVTLMDEMLFGYKTRQQVETAFQHAFDFPLTLEAEAIGSSDVKQYYQGRSGGYNVNELIDYYTKHGQENKAYHAPVFSYMSECSHREIIYHYKELVHDHVQGHSWNVIVYTTAWARNVGGVFKVYKRFERVEYLNSGGHEELKF